MAMANAFRVLRLPDRTSVGDYAFEGTKLASQFQIA